jgi:hypothetical protein
MDGITNEIKDVLLSASKGVHAVSGQSGARWQASHCIFIQFCRQRKPHANPMRIAGKAKLGMLDG